MSLARILFFALLAGGCAKTAPSPDAGMPMHNICPDNPSQCPGTCCGSVCIDTSIDSLNCGGCNVQCEAGSICSNSKCGCLPTGVACGMGQTCCGNNGCKSLESDINNCGSCGKTCGPGATCMNSQCVCGASTCGATEVCCNGTCATTCAGAMDMSMGTCVCPSGCPLSKTCIGPNCCLENFLIDQSCMPDPSCIQS